MIKVVLAVMSLILSWSSLNAQNSRVGGPCEGCEAIYEYGSKVLSSSDTIPEFSSGHSKIKVSGIVYHRDGKTPAANVILYVYHTDDKGIYPKTATSRGWESRHGYLRTWLKTGRDGSYSFYTTRPASYPNSNIPQHIHITVKEPEINDYYIEDFYFEDDPNITENILKRKRPRGGSGVIRLKKQGEIAIAQRDIILGLNIPNYPSSN